MDWKGIPSVVLIDAGVYRDGGLVVVPYRRAGAEHCFTRSASFWRPRGIELTLWADEVPDRPEWRRGRLVWVAEGESDCMAMRGEVAAWRGRPVDVVALPGAGVWKSSFARQLRRV